MRKLLNWPNVWTAPLGTASAQISHSDYSCPKDWESGTAFGYGAEAGGIAEVHGTDGEVVAGNAAVGEHEAAEGNEAVEESVMAAVQSPYAAEAAAATPRALEAASARLHAI